MVELLIDQHTARVVTEVAESVAAGACRSYGTALQVCRNLVLKMLGVMRLAVFDNRRLTLSRWLIFAEKFYAGFAYTWQWGGRKSRASWRLLLAMQWKIGRRTGFAAGMRRQGDTHCPVRHDVSGR